MLTMQLTNRREFVGLLPAMAAASAALGNAAPAKIPVGGHPWVYAAVQPRQDPYPVLDQIFSDMSYAGLDGVELMAEGGRRPRRSRGRSARPPPRAWRRPVWLPPRRYPRPYPPSDPPSGRATRAPRPQ